MRGPTGPLHGLVVTPGVIAVIDSVVAGGAAGVVAVLIDVRADAALAIAAVAFVVTLGLQIGYGERMFGAVIHAKATFDDRT